MEGAGYQGVGGEGLGEERKICVPICAWEGKRENVDGEGRRANHPGSRGALLFVRFIRVILYRCRAPSRLARNARQVSALLSFTPRPHAPASPPCLTPLPHPPASPPCFTPLPHPLPHCLTPLPASRVTPACMPSHYHLSPLVDTL